MRRPTISREEATAWLKSPSVKKDPSEVLTTLDLPDEMLSSDAEPQLLTMDPVTDLSRSPMLEAGVCSNPWRSSLCGDGWCSWCLCFCRLSCWL